MAQYYGSVHGQRGSVHRLGSKNSGFCAIARGWNIGGEVYMYHNKEGHDVVRFSITGGSNGGSGSKTIAEFIIENGEYKMIYCNDQVTKQEE